MTSLSNLDLLELERRIQYLQYGYEARTKSTLEKVYPNTQRLLGDRSWNYFGYGFSKNEVNKFTNLNEIGYIFPNFLGSQGVNSYLVNSASMERNLLKASVCPLLKEINTEEFANFTGTEKLVYHQDVIFQSVELEITEEKWAKSEKIIHYVIFRDSWKHWQPRILPLEVGLFEILQKVDKMTIAELMESSPDQNLLQASMAFGLNRGFFSLLDIS